MKIKVYLCTRKKTKAECHHESMCCRKTQCSQRDCRNRRRQEPTRRLLRRQRIPGDLDFRSLVYLEGAARIYRPVETVDPTFPAHDTPPVRHQADCGPRDRKTVRDYRVAHGQGRRRHQLRRCRSGGRAHSTVGNAEGGLQMPGLPPVDFVVDRRVDSGRIPEP